MNKKDWQEARLRVSDNLKMAKSNLEIAEKNVIIISGQIEESSFMISAYDEKIKTFK